MENTLRKSLFFVALATVGFTACAPEVPYAPTWEKDLRPLMVARCVRCHDGAGHKDPLSGKYHPILNTPAAVPNLNYDTKADIPESMLNIIKNDVPKAVRGTLMAFPIMPPPPAEKLEDWEIQTIDNWAANPR